MGRAPRVDVLLPARNAAGTLVSALRSLVRQSEPRWRCVLVAARDSTDATLRLAADAARSDPRIEVLAHDLPPGIVPALQLGLDACDAPFTARMDADDVCHRHRLRDQLALLDASPQLGAAGCHTRLSPSRLRADYAAWLRSLDSPTAIARDRFVECPLAHPTLTFRTVLLRAHGYRDGHGPEDYDLLLRLLAHGVPLGVVPRRRLLWRDAPRRLSRVDPRYSLASFARCKAEHLAAGFLADTDGYDLWGYGTTGKAIRRALAPHGKRLRTIVELDPRRLGRTIHGACVVAPAALERRGHLLVSVAGREERTALRRHLADRGFRDTIDFFCVA